MQPSQPPRLQSNLKALHEASRELEDDQEADKAMLRQPDDEPTATAVLPAKRLRERAPAAPRPAATAAADGGASRKKSKRDEEIPELADSNEEAAGDFTSTRELVIRWEDERAMAEMAGKATPFAKEKTGYQLYHMHRVAEIKSRREGTQSRKADGGVKHHEAFKKAARDWSRLPESEKEWYNNRADKKPMHRPVKVTGYEDINSLHVVDDAVNNLLHEVHVHQSNCAYLGDHVVVDMPAAHLHPLFDSPPSLSEHEPGQPPQQQHQEGTPQAAAAAAAMQELQPTPLMAERARSRLSDPPQGQPTGSSSEIWLCSNCSNGDATSALGLCLLCASFNNPTPPQF